MSKKPQSLFRNRSGFSLVEVVVGVLLTSIITITLFQVVLQTNRSQSAGMSLFQIQQNARSGAEIIQSDLRQAGFGVSPLTNVPVEVASEFRVTLLIDRDEDGVIENGERITYFIDPNPDAFLVGDTPNTHDYLLRRIVSSDGDPQATPGSGRGDVISYGITQRSGSGFSWNTRLFDYLDEDGNSLIGSGLDPTDQVFGNTVAGEDLGLPVGSGNGVRISSFAIQVVIESPEEKDTGEMPTRVTMGSTVQFRNAGMFWAGTLP